MISFPDPPFFPPFITNHTQVIENNPATIPCPAVGTPPPLITWYKNDVLLTGDETGVTFLDDGGLELYNVNAKDTATYKCVATNAAGETELFSLQSMKAMLDHFSKVNGIGTCPVGEKQTDTSALTSPVSSNHGKTSSLSSHSLP